MYLIINFNNSIIHLEILPYNFSDAENSFSQVDFNSDVQNHEQDNQSADINESNVVSDSNSENVNNEWRLVIPKINLDAVVELGTSEEILNRSIGNFEETSNFDGNVGLAAHNRGYSVNYFENIKELEVGDEIDYWYHGSLRKYKVVEKNIIKENNWSYLEKTEDNRITLITCVENEPEYRRCIQGIEIKEE